MSEITNVVIQQEIDSLQSESIVINAELTAIEEQIQSLANQRSSKESRNRDIATLITAYQALLNA